MTGAAGPGLSVVVPSVTGWDSLAGCLAALHGQHGGPAIEVLVVDRLGDDVRSRVRAQFPGVTVLPAPEGTSIPAMRVIGIRAARAPIVGVIEDHVLAPPTWADRMLAAHREGAEVVGGSIENAATTRRSDWAAFLCEYHHCLSPAPPGPATWLPGNNVTYRRSVLERFRAVLEAERWEDHLHTALHHAGVVLERRPEIVVGHKLEITPAQYAEQRFLYSRAFAAMRVAAGPVWKRWVYGLAALALPPVLLLRIVRAVWRSGRYRRELLPSLPLFIPFVLAWSAGEAAGAWFGAGSALGRVR